MVGGREHSKTDMCAAVEVEHADGWVRTGRNGYNHFVAAAGVIDDFQAVPNEALFGDKPVGDGVSSGKLRLMRASALWKRMQPAERAEWAAQAAAFNAAHSSD